MGLCWDIIFSMIKVLLTQGCKDISIDRIHLITLIRRISVYAEYKCIVCRTLRSWGYDLENEGLWCYSYKVKASVESWYLKDCMSMHNILFIDIRFMYIHSMSNLARLQISINKGSRGTIVKQQWFTCLHPRLLAIHKHSSFKGIT